MQSPWVNPGNFIDIYNNYKHKKWKYKINILEKFEVTDKSLDVVEGLEMKMKSDMNEACQLYVQTDLLLADIPCLCHSSPPSSHHSSRALIHS